MKKKIKKVKSSPDLVERLNGIGVFRITGPSVVDGKRVTLEFAGTRKEAEKVELR